MIITVKGFAAKLDETVKEDSLGAPLGRRSSKIQDVKYNKVGMWAVLVCSFGLSISGLAFCIVSALRDNLPLVFAGVLILMIGNYLTIAAVKEKSNLDLIAAEFKNLSAESRDELLEILVKENIGSTGGILKLIEMVMNFVFKGGSK